MNSNEPNQELEPRSFELQQLVGKVLDMRRQGRLLIQAGDMGYASAPSNIALLKYWGKTNASLQLPVSSSISRNLDGFRSTTQVRALTRFFPIPEERFVAHRFWLNQSDAGENSASNQSKGVLPQKMLRFVDLFFRDWAPETAVEIFSDNNFPTGCGVASSASGYAALAGALTHMAGIDRLLSKNELELWLTEWARLGSGSATRSAVMTDQRAAYVAWQLRDEGVHTAAQMPITETFEIAAHPHFRKLRHFLFVVSEREKKTSSSAGHEGASSSLFQKLRVAGMAQRFRLMKAALESGDFETIRILTEEDALSMHAVMATSATPVRYISDTTAWVIAEFLRTRELRRWNALWTLDAGPNVHFLVEERDSREFLEFLETLLDTRKSETSLKVLSADVPEKQPPAAPRDSLNPPFRVGSEGCFGLILGPEKGRVKEANA